NIRFPIVATQPRDAAVSRTEANSQGRHLSLILLRHRYRCLLGIRFIAPGFEPRSSRG
ncbi:hypothetical protein J6590_015325, partial [Homalodisca vitripennis]